jgi:hypothetical protein
MLKSATTPSIYSQSDKKTPYKRKYNTRSSMKHSSKSPFRKEEESVSIGGGRTFVNLNDVTDSDKESIKTLLDDLSEFDPTVAPLQKIEVKRHEESALYDKYTIVMIWEGSKPFTNQFVKVFRLFTEKLMSTGQHASVEYTISFDIPTASQLVSNAQALEKSGIIGNDTHHRAALLGLKSVLVLRIELGETPSVSHRLSSSDITDFSTDTRNRISKKRRRTSSEPSLLHARKPEENGILESVRNLLGF